MITLHNLKGEPLALNGALVERVDGGPETHVMLVNGTSYIVKESIEEVVHLHREDRAAVHALAERLLARAAEEAGTTGEGTRDGLLRLVTPVPTEDGGTRT